MLPLRNNALPPAMEGKDRFGPPASRRELRTLEFIGTCNKKRHFANSVYCVSSLQKASSQLLASSLFALQLETGELRIPPVVFSAIAGLLSYDKLGSWYPLVASNASLKITNRAGRYAGIETIYQCFIHTDIEPS